MSMILIATFVLGILTGSCLFIAFGLYHVAKLKKAKKMLVEELDKKKNSVKKRFAKASEIAQLQVELRAKAEMPSKNSAHSRYKNGLISEIYSLEQQKLDILRSILDEGFDPVITTTNEHGNIEDMPLSSYINNAQRILSKSNEPPSNANHIPSSKAEEPRRVGKFIVHKGGKDDGTIH